LRQKSESALRRIIILTGFRQTKPNHPGRPMLPSYAALSLENPLERIGYAKLTASQWKDLYPRAVLDEVQKEPYLFVRRSTVMQRRKAASGLPVYGRPRPSDPRL
jgi:hypothetical protein